MIWFSSDEHFYHRNVIGLCKRPFANLEEMHVHMIQEWNKRVKPTEKAYIIGDFSFGNKTQTKAILDQLLGYKILIKGNHDKQAADMLECGFQEVHENIYIDLGDHRVYLSHFPYHPMKFYNKNEFGVVMDEEMLDHDRRYLHKRIVDDGKNWLIHGHVHGAWKTQGRQINVGVDVWDFKPVPHAKILALIEQGENSETDK